MGLTQVIKAIPMTSIASTAVNNVTYTVINTTGLPKSCFKLKIINNSDISVTLSFDGANAHDYSVTATTLELQDIPSQSINGGVLFPAGTKIYAKATAGASGSIYLVGYYQV